MKVPGWLVTVSEESKEQLGVYDGEKIVTRWLKPAHEHIDNEDDMAHLERPAKRRRIVHLYNKCEGPELIHYARIMYYNDRSIVGNIKIQ